VTSERSGDDDGNDGGSNNKISEPMAETEPRRYRGQAKSPNQTTQHRSTTASWLKSRATESDGDGEASEAAATEAGDGMKAERPARPTAAK
jgi:hypothetical protein